MKLPIKIEASPSSKIQKLGNSHFTFKKNTNITVYCRVFQCLLVALFTNDSKKDQKKSVINSITFY